jgi:hypothetical protein
MLVAKFKIFNKSIIKLTAEYAKLYDDYRICQNVIYVNKIKELG